MRFCIKLFEDLDLTEFRRIAIATDGGSQSDYHLCIDDVVFKIVIGGLFITDCPKLASMAICVADTYGVNDTVMPRHHIRFKALPVIQEVFDEWRYWVDIQYQTSDELFDSVEKVVSSIKRANKLKAFI